MILRRLGPNGSAISFLAYCVIWVRFHYKRTRNMIRVSGPYLKWFILGIPSSRFNLSLLQAPFIYQLWLREEWLEWRETLALTSYNLVDPSCDLELLDVVGCINLIYLSLLNNGIANYADEVDAVCVEYTGLHAQVILSLVARQTFDERRNRLNAWRLKQWKRGRTYLPLRLDLDNFNSII